MGGHTHVTTDCRAADYSNANARMKTIVRLEGKEYQKDNLLVWQLMHPLVLERLQLGDL